MKLFRTSNRDLNADTRRVYATYEIAHTAVDFCAALCFLVGSVLFFWPEWEALAIWFFVVGSIFFMMKPTLRLVREIQLYRMGDMARLAERLDED